MQIKRISAFFFSPSGGTEKVLDAFLSALSFPVHKLNVTPYARRGEREKCSSGELAVFAAPVYAGRIAPPAAQRFSDVKGANTPAVCLAVYGNRACEDALLELRDLVRSNGFVPFACVAAVAQHSIMRAVAAGRPDVSDRSKLAAFACAVREKLTRAVSADKLSIPSVPGVFPYKPFKAVGFVPAASAACTGCGRCAALCPAGAISASSPQQTDKTRCIFCMGCVSGCPVSARGVNRALLWAAEKTFALKFGARKEPEFFL